MEVLKKKLSSYRTPKGRLTSVPDELLGEILSAWEHWTGPASGFHTALGADYRKMAGLIGRAKRLKREGHFPTETFKEVKIEDVHLSSSGLSSAPCSGVEILWDNNKLIRFQQVEQLVDFLKKVA
jgi:hypothetical protein